MQRLESVKLWFWQRLCRGLNLGRGLPAQSPFPGLRQFTSPAGRGERDSVTVGPWHHRLGWAPGRCPLLAPALQSRSAGRARCPRVPSRASPGLFPVESLGVKPTLQNWKENSSTRPQEGCHGRAQSNQATDDNSQRLPWPNAPALCVTRAPHPLCLVPAHSSLCKSGGRFAEVPPPPRFLECVLSPV